MGECRLASSSYHQGKLRKRLVHNGFLDAFRSSSSLIVGKNLYRQCWAQSRWRIGYPAAVFIKEKFPLLAARERLKVIILVLLMLEIRHSTYYFLKLLINLSAMSCNLITCLLTCLTYLANHNIFKESFMSSCTHTLHNGYY